MRILHINTERTWRGGEQQTLYLARGLQQRGHECTVACPPGAPLAASARSEDLDVVEMRMRGEADLAAMCRLARLIRSRRCDIVHMHTSHAHTLGCFASLFARRGVRVVSRRVDFSIVKNPFSRLKYRWGVDRYVAISDAVKAVMVADGVAAERIAVVHSGVDISRFDSVEANEQMREDLKLQPGQPVIGNVAHLAKHKGHRCLLDAVPEIIKEFPDAKFMIVGDGELRADLERQVAGLGIEGSVIFTGFRKDVPRLLSLFDLFVMASHMEGLCTSVMDAMAARVPAVVTDAGGLPELVRNEVSGLVVPAKDPAALALAIVRLLRNREEAARFAAAARRTVEEKYSVDAMVEGNIRVYDDLLKNALPSGQGG
jgi:glycosyltransferase involved in cell wall biosynthesis